LATHFAPTSASDRATRTQFHTTLFQYATLPLPFSSLFQHSCAKNCLGLYHNLLPMFSALFMLLARIIMKGSKSCYGVHKANAIC
jgi:hypothetical protein